MNIPKLKTVPLLCALFFMNGCATVGVGTLGSPSDEKRATELLMAMDKGQALECGTRTVVKKVLTEVYKHAPGEQDEIETWTLDRCGKLVNYWVTLTTVPRSEEKLLQVKRQPEQ